MAKFTPLEVLAWIKKLGPIFKDAFILLVLSCILTYIQIKVDEPILSAAAKFWIPTQHVFQFNGVELCPTLEEFSAIMGKPNVSTFILPTIDKDFFDMAHQLLGIPLAMAQRWCNFSKLNIRMVFMYFYQKNAHLAGE